MVLRRNRLSEGGGGGGGDSSPLVVKKIGGGDGESVDHSVAALRFLDSTGRSRLAAEHAVASNDLSKLKDELLRQVYPCTYIPLYIV